MPEQGRELLFVRNPDYSVDTLNSLTSTNNELNLIFPTRFGINERSPIET